MKESLENNCLQQCFQLHFDVIYHKSLSSPNQRGNGGDSAAPEKGKEASSSLPKKKAQGAAELSEAAAVFVMCALF